MHNRLVNILVWRHNISIQRKPQDDQQLIFDFVPQRESFHGESIMKSVLLHFLFEGKHMAILFVAPPRPEA